MAALEDEVRDAGMPGVILDTGTDETFEAARTLYRDLGYVDQGGVYLGGWSDPIDRACTSWIRSRSGSSRSELDLTRARRLGTGRRIA